MLRGEGGEAADTDFWVVELEGSVGVEDAGAFGAELAVHREDRVFDGVGFQVKDIGWGGDEEGGPDAIAEFGRKAQQR